MTDLAAYRSLIARKRVAFVPHGLDTVPPLHPALRADQRHCVEFALRAGCSAQFLGTGMGKTFTSLEFGRVVVEHTRRPVLMLAPLAVGHQHVREAERFGIEAQVVRSQDEVGARRIYVTNYERLDAFDPDRFGGVVLDESSILKNFTGKTTRKLTSAFSRTPFRLACTATPAPNDHTELGQHAAFLGVMDAPEMLSRWFIADQAQMGRYRLKRAAVNSFWEWVASWARCATRPSDLGFDDDGFVLPPLEVVDHHVEADRTISPGEERDGQARLFRIPETSATSIHYEKRLSLEARADTVAAVVTAEPDEAWIVWVDTDYEADAVMSRLPGAVEVRGSQSPEEKERRLVAFSEGRSRVIVTKPKLAGFGLNWQHCARQCFAGLSFSYEAYHQAVRRCWRFGQKRPVRVHVVCADTEAAIKAVVDRKGEDHDAMGRAMAAAMRRASITSEVYQAYRPQKEAALPAWLAA